MHLHAKAARHRCPASWVSADNSRPASSRNIYPLGDRGRSGGTGEPRLKARNLLLTTTGASVIAGALGWRSTRSPEMSLGLVLLVTLIGIAMAWLCAREETRQVEAREHGETERARIRHYAANKLADTHGSLIQAAICGPSSSPDDAKALRMDARKVLRQSPPIAVKDAMRITRTINVHEEGPPDGRDLELSP